MTTLHSDLNPDLGRRGNISIYAYPLVSVRIEENRARTGVVLVSRCGCRRSLIRAPHFLQTISAYTPDLERLEV